MLTENFDGRSNQSFFEFWVLEIKCYCFKCVHCTFDPLSLNFEGSFGFLIAGK